MIRRPLRFSNVQDTPIVEVISEHDVFLWIQKSKLMLEDSESIKNLSSINFVDPLGDPFSIPIWNNIQLSSDDLEIKISENKISDDFSNLQIDFKIKEEQENKITKPVFFANIFDANSPGNFEIDLSTETLDYFIKIDETLASEIAIMTNPLIRVKIKNYHPYRLKRNLLVKNTSNEDIRVLLYSEYGLSDQNIVIQGYENELPIHGVLTTINPLQSIKFEISEFGYHPDWLSEQQFPIGKNTFYDTSNPNTFDYTFEDFLNKDKIIITVLNKTPEYDVYANCNNSSESFNIETIKIWESNVYGGEYALRYIESIQIPLKYYIPDIDDYSSYNIEDIKITLNGEPHEIQLPDDYNLDYYYLELKDFLVEQSGLNYINIELPDVFNKNDSRFIPKDTDYSLFISTTVMENNFTTP